MSEFGFLAAPARRAMANAGIVQLSDLAKRREAEVVALHGMGPNAMRKLNDEMARKGVSFVS
jgi:predicted Fe-Mo cluster-binding NifX family protein